jgi:hypothetical protein
MPNYEQPSVVEVEFSSVDRSAKQAKPTKLDQNKVFNIVGVIIVALNITNLILYYTLIKPQ